PPHLYAIFPAQTLNDPRNSVLYQNGAFSLGLQETLLLESIAPDLVKRKYKDPEVYQDKMKKLADAMNRIDEWYPYAPIKEWPPAKELGIEEEFRELLTPDLEDEYWD